MTWPGSWTSPPAPRDAQQLGERDDVDVEQLGAGRTGVEGGQAEHPVAGGERQVERAP